MKNFIILSIIVLMAGCTKRLGDFTLVSTKNVEIGAQYVKVERNVHGENMKPIIIAFPLGYPDIESAIDDALRTVEDGVLMTDVVLTYRWWYIPYIYGQYIYEVDGDVWKKKNVDIGEILNESEKFYEAIEKNGEIVLVEHVTK